MIHICIYIYIYVKSASLYLPEGGGEGGDSHNTYKMNTLIMYFHGLLAVRGMG